MMIIIKYLITAVVVVAVSEIAKRSDQLGAFVAALPIVTFMVLIWLHIENQSSEKISNHAYYTFWYVLPTLPMFLIFPYLNQQLGFWWGLSICFLMTIVLFFLWALFLKKFGIQLF